MPELLQEDFTAEALYLTLKPWMTDEKSRREAAERLEETMSLLECDADALGKIARMVLGKED
jgi:lipid A disaccharide synthetase